jgi:hypothetical protein
MQVQELISQDVDLLARDAQGHTALHLAASKGHAGVVQLLGEAGGLQLLFKMSYEFRTAEDCAALHRHKDTVQVLRKLQDNGMLKLLQQEEEKRACRKQAEQMGQDKYKNEKRKKNRGSFLLDVQEYTEIVYNFLLCTSAKSIQVQEDADMERFAKELKCGAYKHAAHGLSGLLNVDEKEVSMRAYTGVAAIEKEVEELGDDDVSTQLRYILRQRAREKTFSNGVRDKGHAGMRLCDFLEHEHCKTAKLEAAEVVALRLYTTSAFQQINDPLRDEDRIHKGEPHPLPVTVMLIARGIRKLRAIGAESKGARQTVVLWRGMKNVKATKEFVENGGTEVCMLMHVHILMCMRAAHSGM